VRRREELGEDFKAFLYLFFMHFVWIERCIFHCCLLDFLLIYSSLSLFLSFNQATALVRFCFLFSFFLKSLLILFSTLWTNQSVPNMHQQWTFHHGMLPFLFFSKRMKIFLLSGFVGKGYNVKTLIVTLFLFLLINSLSLYLSLSSQLLKEKLKYSLWDWPL